MQYDVAIIGGGIIGLSCAWRLAQRDVKVLLLERGELAREASWTAAGMLAPGCETSHAKAESQALKDLSFQSRDLYADFCSELLETTQIDVELSLAEAKSTFDDWRTPGILQLGKNGQGDKTNFDLSQLPWLSEETHHQPALWLPHEGQVDCRKLNLALAQAARMAGVDIKEDAPVRKIVCEKDHVSHLEAAADKITAAKVLLCAGAWSGQIEGLPQSCTPAVRPVAGQMLALRPIGEIDRIIFARPDIYLVPRRDGRLVVGSSMEEMGFEKRTTKEHAERKWQQACEIVPALRNSKIVEHWCGFRPAAPDDLPILGSTALDNLYMATGHHRHGILLAPATAQLMADHILNNAPIDEAFSPLRFGNYSPL